MWNRAPDADYFRFLYAELRRLDLLLEREILRLRAVYRLSLDEFHGLYVSDEQVESLIAQWTEQSSDAPAGKNRRQVLAAEAESLRAKNGTLLAEETPWRRLVNEYGLTPLEQDIVLLALAPEIELKYEALYAYVNNDVTRKWPTLDLAMRLFADSPAQREQVRALLAPDALLLRQALLHMMPVAADRPHAPARCLLVTPSVGYFLMGRYVVDAEFSVCVTMPTLATDADRAWQQLPLPAPRIAELRRLTRFFAPSRKHAPLLVLEGRAGAGRHAVAEALCRELGISLLCVDLERARASALPLDKLAAWLLTQARLWRVAIYFENGSALFGAEGRPATDVQALLVLVDELSRVGGAPLPLFLACPPDCAWRELLVGRSARAVRFDAPDFAQRGVLWRSYLTHSMRGRSDVENGTGENGHPAASHDHIRNETITSESIANIIRRESGAIDELAGRYLLTPEQIRLAIDAAVDATLMRDDVPNRLCVEDLVEAARSQSDHSLARLAVKISTPHDWDDLVLSPTTMQRVREIAGAIRSQHVVYGQWAFARRVGAGQGVKVLFAGASGTGKTMTAGVLARDTGLDLYKIDLSGVVSKFIGETEKNLESIFRAARHSNALLFFDEADALFGKRSEVKDAHDRYANIEISYLLQRMEQHEGAVILASNLSKNIDDAFSRRMHFVVEFPLPDEDERDRLWRGMFPTQAPLGADVDLSFLAQNFAVAGGDIQNIALDAAFLAAQDGRVIGMKHLAQAMARQMSKQGRVPSVADFKQYHALIG